MEVGQLNRRVELINLGLVKTAAGGFTRSDAVEAVVWGNVRIASFGRQQRAERLEQRVSHVITIRWQSAFARGFGPTARARFRDAGGAVRELAVKTVIDPQDRRRWLELECDEGGPT